MKLLVGILVVLAGLGAKAQTLLISDVDDTLKISHVLNWADMVANGPKTGNHFLGSSEALRIFVQNQTDQVTVAYVSNAPAWLMGNLHRKFIESNRFPVGNLFLRANERDQSHKLQTIRNLIQQVRPRTLIMIGDNGEEDNQVYQTIASENKQLTVYTWIHQIYSVRNTSETGAPLLAKQLGYVTSVDLVRQWVQMGLVSGADANRFYGNVIPMILMERNNLTEGQIAFPRWLDCRDSTPFPGAPETDLLRRYDEKKNARCAARR